MNRLIGSGLYAVGNNAAHVKHIPHHSSSLGLQHDIADGRSLHGSCYHGHIYAVGSHLHEIGIICSSSYYVELLDGEGSQLLQIIKHLTIAQSQTLKDASCYLPIVFRNGLIGLPTEILNGIHHALWVGKSRIIGVDE